MRPRFQHLLACFCITSFTLVIVGDGGSAWSQQSLQSGSGVALNDGVPREVENVTVEQNLGGTIPLNLPIYDSMGRRVKTGYFIDGKKPTIVTLNYSSCPMLCSVQLNKLTESLAKMKLKIGEDFQILTISIDPNETPEMARKTKTKYVDQLLKTHPKVEDGWAFCTAQQQIIAEIADRLGFQYRYDAVSGEYYHPAMLAFVSPEGVITRYSLNVDFEVDDMRKALVEAGEGTVGTPVDQFILWCFQFDPSRNSYVPQAWRIMRVSGAATIFLMLACLAPYWIGKRRLPQTSQDASADPTDSPADTLNTTE